MKNAIVLLFTLLLAGCARDKLVVTSGFRSLRIERELNYYVANFSSHETNHFYVGATKLIHGQLVEAMVYWKEERMLLPYVELEPDAWADIEAWYPQRDQLKLDRDTVDTPEEIGSSTYLETHRYWVDWMEDCIRKGKPYCVLKSEALRVAPSGMPPDGASITHRSSPAEGDSQTNANGQYNGPRISAMDIILKTSDIAAALYAKTNKPANRAVPPAYRDTVLSIQQRVGLWVCHDDFFENTNFIALYEHPVDYASNAVLFLKSADNPEDAKLIVIYSLQRLPLARYVEFESQLIDMAESRQISNNLLNRAIFPGWDWSTKIQKNFSNQQVSALIRKIKKCPQINSNNREYLQDVASGKAREDILEFESAGMLSAKQSEE